MLLMTAALIAAVLLLAFMNGANDNFKGVATLYGSGVLDYRRALALATVSTAVGSALSVLLASGLVRAFSGKGIVPQEVLDPTFLLAVALGAGITLVVATRLGLPISTTHALVGGLTGAGLAVAGPALDLGALGPAFVLPLLAGPLLAIGLAHQGLRLGTRATRWAGIDSQTRWSGLGEWMAEGQLSPAPVRTHAGATVQRAALAEAEPREEQVRYRGELGGVSAESLASNAHLWSASLVGFARGLNDTPKILGLLVGASALSPFAGTVAITLAMAAGGILAARPVGETMGRKITRMTPGQGLIGNMTTSVLVIGASRFGLPVSTTHVSTGGIFGIAGANGPPRWRMIGEIGLAWATTLPLAAALAWSIAVALKAAV
jgi:PiT family inorganic phosphate transporter